MRRNLTEKTRVQAPSRAYGDSWEEQAFAEDSAGPLGGCIWPPRSYSCSFCRREFRSAQALGGHMNVHRRDRARLKQSPNPSTEIVPSSSLSGVLQYPSQPCSLAYNTSNPNINLTTSRVSTSSILDMCNDQEPRVHSLFSAPARPSDTISIKVTSLSDSKLEWGKKLRIEEIGFGGCAENTRADSDVNFNFSAHSVGDENEVTHSKRRKIEVTSLPFFLRPKSLERPHIHSDAFGLKPTSIDEIDLELRLGDRPKVK